MNRSIIIFFLTCLFKVAYSQQDEQFSQYMYNQMDYNPGSAGNKEAICVSALTRQQWVGFPDHPASSVFSANAPIKPFKINSGIGVTMLSDNIGFDRNIGAKLAYAYRMNVNNGIGKLGIGISGGFINKTLKVTTWQSPTPGTETSDPSIPNTNDSGTTFDMGFGAFYKTDNLYLGLSATHIAPIPSKIKFKQRGSYTNTIHTYLTAGYNLPLKNPQFDFQPSILIMTDTKSSNIDLNGVLLYNKRIWGGVTYRVNSAIVGMIGIELMSGLKVGYSYDFSTSDLNKYSNGSHELMIGYCFNISKEKIPHKSKSVRFL